MRPFFAVPVVSGAFALSQLLAAAAARADGEELLPGGAQATGRAGATTARPSDASTLLRNPAGLVELSTSQGLYGADLSLDDNCVEKYGYYGWGVYPQEQRQGTEINPDANRSEFGDATSTAYGARRLDRVCNSGPTLPIPQLAFAFKLNELWSAGIGLMTPALVTGANWGGKDGTIAVRGPNGIETRPTPTRYELIRSDGFGLNIVGGLALRASRWLSVGANLQVGMLSTNQYVATALRAGTSPANDMLTKLHVTDYFIPAFTLGVYTKPSQHWRLAGTFYWSDDFDGRGELSYTTNSYHQGAVGGESLPLPNDPVKLKRAVVAMPWTATVAVRYAQPRALTYDREPTDPLDREAWDIELDASYTANKSLGANTIEIANDFSLQFRRADGAPQMPLEVEQDDISELSVERHLKDVVVLRLGGGWNVLPGRLQISAGAFYQTRGVDPDYATITSFGLQRLGVGLGVLVRLGKVDLLASYAHIFQETLEVAPPSHEPREQDDGDPHRGFDQRIYQDGQLSDQPRRDPRAPSPGAADGVASLRQSAVFESDTLRARVVNAGRFLASFDVISVSVVHRY